MTLFLGADGGGTSTVLTVADAAGAVLSRVVAPSTSYFGHGVELVERVLQEGVGRALAEAGAVAGDLRSAFFAIPGYGESSADAPLLAAVPARILGHDRYACGNDMLAGWAGALAGADGIDVVAGTGSMAYGELRGTGARSGGWGEVFGDEGSAHWVAVEGLRAFARMSDGRQASSALLPAIREALGLRADLDAIGVVLGEWASDRGRVASLAPVVTAAAEAGDAAALGVVEEAGRHLASLVTAVRAAVGAHRGESIPVSVSGGLFAAPSVRASFEAALAPEDELRLPVHGPDLGAVILAMRRVAAPVPPRFAPAAG